MPEERKKLVPLNQRKKLVPLNRVVAAIVLGVTSVGGTSPWWFNALFIADNKPEQPKVESSVASESKPAPREEFAKTDRSDLEYRQRQVEEELAELKRDRDRKARHRAWLRNKRSAASPERDREPAANSRWRSSRQDTE
jgi:hypothetical protein